MVGAAMAGCQGAVDDPDFVDLLTVGVPDHDAGKTLWQRTLCFYNLPDLTQPARRGMPGQPRKLEPDPVTIGIGVSACGKGEQWTKSLQLVAG